MGYNFFIINLVAGVMDIVGMNPDHIINKVIRSGLKGRKANAIVNIVLLIASVNMIACPGIQHSYLKTAPPINREEKGASYRNGGSIPSREIVNNQKNGIDIDHLPDGKKAKKEYRHSGYSDRNIAGWVVGFNLSTEHYRIIRDDSGIRNEFFPIIGSYIFNGDNIFIEDEKAFLTIAWPDGNKRRIQKGECPYIVDYKGKNAHHSSHWEKLMLAWQKVLDDETFGAAVRRGAIEIPLVPVGTSPQIAEGQRKFTLTWKGGIPPYTVRWYPGCAGHVAGEWTVMDTGEDNMAHLKTQALTFHPTAHCIEIKDSSPWKRRRKEIRFTAVEKHQIPKAPEGPGIRDMPAVLRENYPALWLANLDGGRWLLESYLQLNENTSTLGKGYEVLIGAGRAPSIN
jgi:hypothetical protein